MKPIVMTRTLLNYDMIALICGRLILGDDDPLIKEQRELLNSGKTNAERKKIRYKLLPILTLKHHWLRVLAQTCRWFKRCVYKYRRDTTQPTFDHLNQPGALYIEQAMTRNMNKHKRAVKRTYKLARVEKHFIKEIGDAIIVVKPLPEQPVVKNFRNVKGWVDHHMPHDPTRKPSRIKYRQSKKQYDLEASKNGNTKKWPSYRTCADVKKAHRDVHVLTIPRDMRYNGVRLIDVLFRNKCKFLKHLGYMVRGHLKFCDTIDTKSFVIMISIPKKALPTPSFH